MPKSCYTSNPRPPFSSLAKQYPVPPYNLLLRGHAHPRTQASLQKNTNFWQIQKPFSPGKSLLFSALSSVRILMVSTSLGSIDAIARKSPRAGFATSSTPVFAQATRADSPRDSTSDFTASSCSGVCRKQRIFQGTRFSKVVGSRVITYARFVNPGYCSLDVCFT